MRPLLDRLTRALAAALLLAAPSAAGVVEAVRVEAPRVPAIAAAAGTSVLRTAPALASLSAPSVPAAPSAAPSAAPVPAAAGWADARVVAARLTAARGVPREGHAYFHEMVARYLYNGLDDASLAALARDPAAAPRVADRWTGKLLRDLDQPYDDSQALARLDHLQSELEDCARWLRSHAPKGGFRLLLMGGLLRGRVSAHSDVDLILLSDDPAFMREAMEGPFGYLSKGRDAVLGPMPKNQRLAEAMGETVDLGDGALALSDESLIRREFFRARAALAAGPMERDARLDAELMARIKALGAQLDRANDVAERLRLERGIDELADRLPPPADPLGARPGRFVPVGASRVDRRAPGAGAVLATLGRADGRPVIGLYDQRLGAVVSAAPLGSGGVRGHADILPLGADPRAFTGFAYQLLPDGTSRFAGSGLAPGELTPRMRRALLRHLGVGPAAEMPAGRWTRRFLRAWDALASLLPR